MSVRQLQSERKSHTQNSNQESESLEKTYQAIEAAIDEIQKKLKFAIKQLTSSDAEITDENAYVMDGQSDSKSSGSIQEDLIYKVTLAIEESKKLSLTRLLTNVLKLVDSYKIWSDERYQSVAEFIDVLNESGNNQLDDLLFYAYVFHALLESFKKLYRQLNKVDIEDQSNLINLLVVYCFIEFINENNDPESWGDPFFILEEFIENYEIRHASFNSEILNRDSRDLNIFVMILEKEGLDEKLVTKACLTLFKYIKEVPDVSKVYSEKNPDLLLRSYCDRILARAIRNDGKELVDFLIDKFKLKLKMPDLLRICELEFERPCRFNKSQKKIIFDLLWRMDKIKSPAKRKRKNNKKKKKQTVGHKREREREREQEQEFSEFVRQFNSEAEASGSEFVPSQNRQSEEIVEDMEVKQTIEDEAAVNAQQELEALIDEENGYPRFDVKEKLDALVDQLNSVPKAELNPKDDNEKAPCDKAVEHVDKFRKVLEDFFKYSPKSVVTGNYCASLSDTHTWVFLNACVQINTLCQVVKQWREESQVIVEQSTTMVAKRKLSTEEQRQCKRFLYWQYIQALQIKQFIEERWGNIVSYDQRRDCYILRAPNEAAQRAVFQVLPSMAEETYDSKSTLTVTLSSMADDCHELLESAHHIRLHTKATRKKNKHQQTFFGKLCRAVFVREMTEGVGNVVEEILKEKEKAVDAKLSELDQLAVCFLVTRPGAINLLSDVRKVLNTDVKQPEENESFKPRTASPLPKLMTGAFNIDESSDSDEDMKDAISMADASTTHTNAQTASLPAVKGAHFLLARALEKNGDSSLPTFFTGTSAGLLLAMLLSEESPKLWPDALKKLLKYLEERGGDFDFLTIGSPHHWDGLRATKLRGQYSQLCEWILWESSEPVSCSDSTDPEGKRIQLKLDVVQLQRVREDKDISDEALIQKYKSAGSCVSTLGSFVLRIVDHKTGAYQLIFGDLDAFRAQLRSRQLALVYPAQLENRIEQFKTGKIQQESINATALKVLKFFNDVDCLTSLCESGYPFGIDPNSLVVIVKHRYVINALISSIDFFRKKSFHKKIFQRLPSHVRGYLQLLQTFGLLEGFLTMNFEQMCKKKNISINSEQRKKIKEYKDSVRTFVAFVTIDVKKGVSDENIRTYLAVEKYFRHSRQSSSAEDFLKATAEIYLANQDREAANLFDKEKERYRAFIKNKKSTLCNDLLGHQELTVTEGNSVFSVLSKCELVPELKRVESLSFEPLSFLMAEQHETFRREINAQIMSDIESYSHIENMPKARLEMVAKPYIFSVNIRKDAEGIKQKLAVFYVEFNGKHYAFSGVFEEEVDTEDDEIEMRVLARSKTVNLLSSFLRGNIESRSSIELSYVIIAPCLGMLREWTAIEKLKKDPHQSPILKTLLLPAPPSRSIVADSQENAALIPETLNPKQREAMSQVLRSVDEASVGATDSQVTVIKGPPGTGKTKVICELTAALQAKGVRVLIVAHNNKIVAHIMAVLLQHYPQVTLAGKVRLDSKPQQMIWSLDKLKDCVLMALKGISSAKSIPEAIAQLNDLKQRVGQTMPLFSIRVHALIHRLICEMTEKQSITQEMISNANAEFIALFSRRPLDSETAILAMANVMVGTLHGLAAHHKTQAVLQWCSAVEPDRQLFVIVDEASQASIQAIFPTLLAKNAGMVIVGDPRQLPQITHSQSPPESVLTTCLRNIDPSRVITLEETYRADPFITRLWSNIMYQGRVVCALPAEHQKRYANLRERLSGQVGYLSARPLTLVDMDGQQQREGKSYKNPKEAQSVVKTALDLLAAMDGAKLPWLQNVGTWVAIIPVYRAQLDQITKRLKEAVKKKPWLRALQGKLKLVTVDGSQGQEALYTLICTTRTQPASRSRHKKRRAGQLSRQHPSEEKRGTIGHAVEARRLNVALSRGQCGLFVFLELKLFERVTKAIVAKVVDKLAALADTDTQEGLFIQRSEESTDEEKKGGELSCLARGYRGKWVWCRLQASGETNLQVDVLSQKDGASVETLSVPDVSLSKIHTEDPKTLTALKCRLLNLLSTADNPYLASSVNWLLLLEFFEANRSESATTLSSKAIMGR